MIWYFRQHELRPTPKYAFSEKGSNRTVVIRSVAESDLGNYTCQAVNKLGESEATLTLTGELIAMSGAHEQVVQSDSIDHVDSTFLSYNFSLFGHHVSDQRRCKIVSIFFSSSRFFCCDAFIFFPRFCKRCN